MKTTDLRKQENDLYAKIIELSADYAKDMDRHDKYPADIQANNHMYQLKGQLDLLKDNFKALENNLAHLEGRSPRSIVLEFIPPHAPTNLQVTVK